MSNPLVDRIDETREKWAGELSECREAISVGINVPLDRMVVELDYLVVEAKLSLKAKDTIFRGMVFRMANEKDKVDKLKTQVEALQKKLAKTRIKP